MSVSVLAFIRRCALPAVGIGLGVTTGALVSAHVRGLSPHAELAAQAPDRLYVVLDCAHSRRALDVLAESPGARSVAIIPADPTQSPERDALCDGAVQALRGDGSLWWSLLPSAYICDRLVRESREWLTANMEAAQTPAWVLDGELAEPGLSEATLVALRQSEILADGSALR